MYTRAYSPPPQELPLGYGGEAFSQEAPECAPTQEPQDTPPCAPTMGRGKGWNLSHLFSHINLRELFSGDLLLIAIALLLFLGNEEDDCERDEDLWLLLLLLFFLK